MIFKMTRLGVILKISTVKFVKNGQTSRQILRVLSCPRSIEFP
jgi:hypothetical protein